MDGKSQTDSRFRAAGLYMHSNIPLRIRFSYFSGRGMRKYGKFRLNSAHSLKRVTRGVLQNTSRPHSPHS